MKLYPYQVKGVEHLLSQPFGRPHALLADAPGTGKTPMTIEAAKAVNCKTGVIVCPSIIKEQWKKQMVTWGLCDEDEVQVVYGKSATISDKPWIILNYDIVRETEIRRQILQRQYHVLIMDEAHRLKTHASQQTHSVFNKSYGIASRAYYKWALSGTIMPNRPSELYPILRTLAPECLGKFDTWDKYKVHFCGGYNAEGKGASNIPELTAAIQPFFLKRELDDVWRDCPPVIENTVWLNVPFRSHPEWIENGLEDATERRVVAEAKIPQVVAYVRERLELGIDKICVATYHRAVIEAVSNALAEYQPVKIYGGVPANKRAENIAKFQQDPACRLFLMQIASAGEGLDGLQHVASELILAEPEWSPGREDQLIRRLMRLGQTKPVIYTKLLALDSYEDVIQKSNTRKRRVIDVVCKPNGGTYTMNEGTVEHSLARIASSFEQFAALGQVLAQVIQAGAAQGGLALPTNANLAQPQAQSFAPPMVQQLSPFGSPAPVAHAAPLSGGFPAPATAPAANPFAAPQANPFGAAPISAPSAPAPMAAPTPVATNPGSMSKQDFETQVLSKVTPMGAAGAQKIQQLCAQLGVAKAGECPPEHYAAFVANL